jgi:aerotaxis receptor
MKDMDPADVRGPARRVTLTYHDGSRRDVLVTDLETPFPTGELIVSQTDLEGVITLCNAAFVRRSGYSEAELMGEPHHILRHPDMPAAAFKDLWDTAFRGEKWHGVVKNLRKDGGFYWVHATVVPNVRDGKVTGFTSVRRQPARRQVEAAAALYRQILGA